MLALQAKVDLGVMAMKEYSAFPNVPALLDFYYQILLSYPGHVGKSYPSVEMQSVHSTAIAYRARHKEGSIEESEVL